MMPETAIFTSINANARINALPVTVPTRLEILLIFVNSKAPAPNRPLTSKIVMVMAEKTIQRILRRLRSFFSLGEMGWEVMRLSFLVSIGSERFLDQFGHIRLFVHQDVAGD